MKLCANNHPAVAYCCDECPVCVEIALRHELKQGLGDLLEQLQEVRESREKVRYDNNPKR